MLADPDGGPERVIELPIPAAIAPTDAQFPAAIDDIASALQTADDQEVIRTILRRVPAPEKVPAFRGLLIGDRGDLWVTVSPLGSPTTEVLVVDLESQQQIGMISLPADVELRAVTADRLLVQGSAVGKAEGATLSLYRVTHTAARPHPAP